MEEKKKGSKLLKYLVATGIGLVAAFAIACWRGVLELTELSKILSAISDGFFVMGVVYLGFGLMLLIVNEGILDIIGFGFKSLIYLFTPRRLDRDSGGYYEYRMKKKEERAQKRVSAHIAWIGAAFILVSVILVVVYYNL